MKCSGHKQFRWLHLIAKMQKGKILKQKKKRAYLSRKLRKGGLLHS